MTVRTAIALVFFLATTSVFAQDDPPPPAFRVALEVSLRDEDLKERVSKYLRNELRALGDVEVSAENPDYKLYVMLTEMRAGGGRVAYVLGISVTSFFPDGYFDTILRKDLSNAREVSSLLEAVPVYEHQFLSLAGPSEANLIETVTSSIAQLNTHVLQPKRSKRVQDN